MSYSDEQIAYLGHVISAQGVATDEGKIKAIENWPTPTNVTRGPKLSGIHRILPCQFIPKFAQVAQALHELTLDENAGKKKAAIQWNSKCQQAFDDLKRLCTTAPILAYMQISTQPFKLHTDACGSGLGAVLYQTHEDGTDAVITYASRSLSKAESHYPSAQVGISHPQVGGSQKSSINTCMGQPLMCTWDNNLLTYMLTTAKLDAISHHWVPSLANYNFQL